MSTRIYMAALHAAGRAGRLAAHHVPHRRRRAVLGRHLFPQGAALRPAGLLAGAAARSRGSIATSRDKVGQNADALQAARSSRARRARRTRRCRRRPCSPSSPARIVAGASTRSMAACRARRNSRNAAFFGLLWRGGARATATASCSKRSTSRSTQSCQGGIYDHLGGGFARYSVDERWLVPHFEKMLYDNALLIDLMTEVWQETGSAALCRSASPRRSTGCCARWSAEGGGFAASSMPTPKARRASSMSGRWPRSIERAGRGGRARSSPQAYDVTRRGQLGGTQHSQPAARAGAAAPPRRSTPGRAARQAARAARDARAGPAGTTRCWPTGTA